jgi:hypothetical protein
MSGGSQLRLLLRGLWWRRGLTFAVLTVAVLTTTAAALGPLYARAAAESILQDHLVQAGPQTGLRLYRDTGLSSPGAYAQVVDSVRRVGHVHGYNRLITGFFTPNTVPAYIPHPPLGHVNTYLLWRSGQCGHVVIVKGRCPTGPDEAMASERDVAGGLFHLDLGSDVSLGQIVSNATFIGPQRAPSPVRIVGVYRPRDVNSLFWFGQNYFGQHGASIGASLTDVPTIDPLLVARSKFTTLPVGNFVEADFDYLLTPSAVRLNNVAAERQRVAGILHDQRRFQLFAQTGLLPVLDAASHEHRLIDIATLLVVLQLALLAWLVLFQVVGDAIEARGDEIAMAKLRGYRAWPTIRFGLGEPVAMLAIAVPIGLFAALGVTHVFAASVLVAGIPVLLTWSALGTPLIAFAGGLVAAALAAHRTLTRSVLDQWRHTDRRPGHGRLALVIDVLLAGAALTGLIVLLNTRHAQSSGNTTALLAPALLVFAVGIVGVRLLPLVCRSVARRTRGTRRVGAFLAACQVARRPVGLRLAALLAVAVGLATFGVAGETVTSANRTARADAEVGAPRVVAVQFSPGLDPVRATRSADPAGSWAMAASTWLPDGGGSVLGTVLGVDASRLAAVAEPVRGSVPNAKLARLITANTVRPLVIRTSAMRVHVTAQALHGDTRPRVQLNFRSAGEAYVNAEGPPIRPGSHSYVVRVPCAHKCEFRGLTWDRPVQAVTPQSGTLTLTGLDVHAGARWRSLDIGLGRPRSWYAEKAQGQAADRVRVTARGIVDTFSNRNGGYGGITFGADPSPMPAVATPASMTSGPNVPSPSRITDADSVTATFRVLRYQPLLPQVLDNGVLLNVRYLQDELPAYAAEATWSVWVGSHAPPDWRHRLADAGLQVVSQRSQTQRAAQLARQAPALALLLLLVCALAGAVLAVGGTAISVSASSRHRSYELAALQVVGVGRPALLRASIVEQLLLLGAAVLLGVPTGFLAARLSMPIIPEFADSTAVPLAYSPHVAPTAVFAAAFVALLLVTAVVAARALIRIAVPARLREAE